VIEQFAHAVRHAAVPLVLILMLFVGGGLIQRNANRIEREAKQSQARSERNLALIGLNRYERDRQLDALGRASCARGNILRRNQRKILTTLAEAQDSPHQEKLLQARKGIPIVDCLALYPKPPR